MNKISIFKKNDIIIVLVLLLFAAAGLFVFRMTHRADGKKVRVTIDGVVSGEYELDGTDGDSDEGSYGIDAVAGGEGYLNSKKENVISGGDLQSGQVGNYGSTENQKAEEGRKIELNGKIGKCILVIKNGEAYMESADCPNQICVHHSAVSHNGETIVCLPNRIIIEIT